MLFDYDDISFQHIKNEGTMGMFTEVVGTVDIKLSYSVHVTDHPKNPDIDPIESAKSDIRIGICKRVNQEALGELDSICAELRSCMLIDGFPPNSPSWALLDRMLELKRKLSGTID